MSPCGPPLHGPSESVLLPPQDDQAGLRGRLGCRPAANGAGLGPQSCNCQGQQGKGGEEGERKGEGDRESSPDPHSSVCSFPCFPASPACFSCNPPEMVDGSSSSNTEKDLVSRSHPENQCGPPPLDSTIGDDDMEENENPLFSEPPDTCLSENPRSVDLGFRFADSSGQHKKGRKKRKNDPMGQIRSGQPSLSPIEPEIDRSDPELHPDTGDGTEIGSEQSFQFAYPPPGSMTDSSSRIPPGRLARGGPSQFQRFSGISPPRPPQVPILDHEWVKEYEVSPTFAEIWKKVQSTDQEWPYGHKIFRGKLYAFEKLCVPENLVEVVLRAHHEWLGHVGNNRLLVEIGRRYELPADCNAKEILQKVRKFCLICQACDRPNWALKGPIKMTPIPDRFMASLCLDVFSMPVAEWQGEQYDAFLMCVDRHSGWMIAKPTQKAGLSGERAAHLLLDSSWGEVGIPTVLTSDQGPQFVSQWWVTMCSRLGIRTAYAQSHRPQANGRAEVAGRVLQDVLRKLLINKDINWVQALPHALRIHHDTADPITGLSPYEIVFGRERSLAGLPWRPPRECLEAQDFFDHMREIDISVAQAINDAHQALAEKLNAKRKNRPPYEIDEWVWYARPKSVGGVKLQSWWQGPFKVKARVGEHSYRLRTPQGQEFDAHSDQLKPCEWEEPSEPITNLQYPPLETALAV